MTSSFFIVVIIAISLLFLWNLQYIRQQPNMLHGCGPTGSKACDGTSIRESLPDLIVHFSFQLLYLLWRQNGELLVGGRLDIERYLFVAE